MERTGIEIKDFLTKKRNFGCAFLVSALLFFYSSVFYAFIYPYFILLFIRILFFYLIL